MSNSADYNLWPIDRMGKREQFPYYNIPSIQAFCSNKTYWKFPHRPTGNSSFITGTIYYKIGYRSHFSFYFKNGHSQGMENDTFHYNGKDCKYAWLTKDIRHDVAKMETKLINMICTLTSNILEFFILWNVHFQTEKLDPTGLFFFFFSILNKNII